MQKNSLLYKKIKNIIPYWMRSVIADAKIKILNHKLQNASDWYKASDEKKKYIHILEGINYLGVAGIAGGTLPQTYFEFGCHSGRTFSAAINASKYLKNDKMEFYAFDSFQGLPETNQKEDGIFQTGDFSTSKKQFMKIVKRKTGMNLTDKNIIPGFYCSSLSQELQKRLPKAGLVHIDVDLYSSSRAVLHFLKPLLVPGSLLMFDDWYCFPQNAGQAMGEQRAVDDFLASNPGFTFKPWKAYSTFGQSFFATAVSFQKT